jgi:anthranilate synthase component 1
MYDHLRRYFSDEISFLFESASTSEGNFSFINIGAIEHLEYKNNTTSYTNAKGETKTLHESPFDFLKKYYKKIDTEPYKRQSKALNVGYIDGFIGMVGFDAVKVFEPKLCAAMDKLEDQLDIPDIDLIRPRFSLVFSHKEQKVTLLSPLQEVADQFDAIESVLKSNYDHLPLRSYSDTKEGKFAFNKEQFFDMIAKSKEMILSGDVFQILMANRYQQTCDIDPFSFYRVLRSKNPSPYMFLMQYKDYNIVGSSPEVMVGLQNNEILLRPIAGTRKRGDTPQRDFEMEVEMINDPKECAEHLMLVDLGRNDVGRVAKVGTVKVHDMMHVERYSHVMHMVSDITAILDDEHDMFDLFAATFTAGTMTGAPKIRAMELIAEFEGIKRSFYSGSIAYFGFNGDMDSAITIRTALIKDGVITLQAGAGIVADSQPELEYLEVTNKLGALKSSLEDLKEEA